MEQANKHKFSNIDFRGSTEDVSEPVNDSIDFRLPVESESEVDVVGLKGKPAKMPEIAFNDDTEIIDFIKGYESFMPIAKDIGDGAITGGWGTTGVFKKGEVVSKKRGEEEFIKAFKEARDATDKLLPFVPTKNQRDYFTSLMYNLGPSKFKWLDRKKTKLTKAYQALMAGNEVVFMKEAFGAKTGFISPGSIFEKGLSKRRVAEGAGYSKPDNITKADLKGKPDVIPKLSDGEGGSAEGTGNIDFRSNDPDSFITEQEPVQEPVVKQDNYHDRAVDVYEGLIEPTAKAMVKVPAAIASSLALLPGAGIAAGIKLLPKISMDRDKTWESGSLDDAMDTFKQVMSVPEKFITTEAERQALGAINLAMRPIEMAGEGWKLIGEGIETGLKELGMPVGYIEPLLATMGEAAAIFAMPEIIGGLKGSSTFNKLNVKGKELVIGELAKMNKAGMSKGQILREMGPESRFWKDVLKEDKVGFSEDYSKVKDYAEAKVREVKVEGAMKNKKEGTVKSPEVVKPADVTPEMMFTSQKGNYYEKVGGSWYDYKGNVVDNRWVIQAAEKRAVEYDASGQSEAGDLRTIVELEKKYGKDIKDISEEEIEGYFEGEEGKVDDVEPVETVPDNSKIKQTVLPTIDEFEIGEAALKLPDGKVITGRDHLEAMEKVGMGEIDKLGNKVISGFTDKDGRFYTDKEVKQITGQSENSMVRAAIQEYKDIKAETGVDHRQPDPEMTKASLKTLPEYGEIDNSGMLVNRIENEINSWLDGEKVDTEQTMNLLDGLSENAKKWADGTEEPVGLFGDLSLTEVANTSEYLDGLKEWAEGKVKDRFEIERTIDITKDTRGKDVQFHGTSQGIEDLDDFSYSSTNYYGQGLYSTDAYDIAKGYTKKGKGKDPVVYKLNELREHNLYDMEKPIEDWLYKEFEDDHSNIVLNALEDNPKNLREMYDNIREYGSDEMLSADSIQDIYDSIRYKLEDKGYEGLTHTGGLITKKKPHKVNIYFNPRGLIKLDRLDLKRTDGGGGITLGMGADPTDLFNKLFKRNKITPAEPAPAPFPKVKEEAKEIIFKHSGDLNLANYDTNKFVNSIDQRLSDKQKEAMVFVIEKTDVPVEFNRPDLQKVINKDKVKLEGVAKEIKTHFDEGFKKIKKHLPDLTVKQVEDYVTHLWNIPKHKRAEATSWFSTQNRLLEKRFIPTYAEGIKRGYRPKTLDISEIIKVHDSISNKAIENTKYVNSLMKMNRDGIPLIQRGGDAPLDWIEVDYPALTRRIPLSKHLVKKKGEFVKESRVRVHHDLVRPLKAVFEERFDHPVVSGYEAINGVMKKGMLSGSLFHHGALGEVGIAFGMPGKVANLYFNPAKIYKGLIKGELDIFANEPLAKDAIAAGVQFGATADIPVGKIQSYLNDLAGGTRDVVMLGRITKFMAKGNEVWDKALWSYLHDTLKLYGYESVVAKLDPKMSTEMVRKSKREAAQFVNDTFGGQNWDTLGMTPKEVQMMTWSLLSADWTASTTRQALAPTGIGKIYKETAGLRRKMGTMFWLRAGLYFGIGMNALNAYHRNKDIEDNPQYYEDKEYTWFEKTMPGNTLGKKTYLFKGRYSDGSERYVRWGKQFRDFFEMLIDPLKKIGGKVAPLPQMVSEMFTGHTMSGFKNDDIYGKEGLEYAKGLFKTIAKAPIPISVKRYLDERVEFKPLDIAMQSTKGMTRYKAMKYFKKAIIDGDEELLRDAYVDTLKNNLPAFTLFNSALGWVEAEISAELNDGLDEIEETKEALKNADSAYDKKRYGTRLARLYKENADKKAGLKLLTATSIKARKYKELAIDDGEEKKVSTPRLPGSRSTGVKSSGDMINFR